MLYNGYSRDYAKSLEIHSAFEKDWLLGHVNAGNLVCVERNEANLNFDTVQKRKEVPSSNGDLFSADMCNYFARSVGEVLCCAQRSAGHELWLHSSCSRDRTHSELWSGLEHFYGTKMAAIYYNDHCARCLRISF